MVLTEYNEKVFIDGIRKEGIEEGKAEARVEAKAEIIVNLLSEGFSLEKIATLTNTDLAFVKEVAEKN